MPPMVTPNRYPAEIMEYEMSFSDRELIATHLEAFQGSAIGWDEFRKKIPFNLAEKWQTVLDKCRRQGFIAPRSYNGIVRFKQIMCSRKMNVADKCTLCSNSITMQNCAGQLTHEGEAKVFVPCWMGGN